MPGQLSGQADRHSHLSDPLRGQGPRQEHEQGHLPPDHWRVGLHLAGALQELDLRDHEERVRQD